MNDIGAENMCMPIDRWRLCPDPHPHGDHAHWVGQTTLHLT
ncbi:MAG: hypothetical protein ACX93P_07800 [Roseovarius sp.]